MPNLSEDRKKLFSETRRAQWQKPEYRDKMLVVLRSADRRAKISVALSGKSKSKEHIENLSKSQSGRKLSESRKRQALFGLESARKISADLRSGKSLKRETCAKISHALKGNKHTLGRHVPRRERYSRSVALLGVSKTDQHKQRIRNAALNRWEKQERKNRVLSFRNETLLLRDWADRVEINSRTLAHRLRLGWTIEETLTMPIGKRRVRKKQENDKVFSSC